MESAAEFPLGRKPLRPYQDDVASRFRNALVDSGRGQIVMATGLGKTIVMADVVSTLYADGRMPNGRALVLAHTKPLVDQLQREFWHQLPKWIATHRLADGERPIHWDGITFATIQSALSHIQDLPHFDLVLVDEAHHIGATTFRKVLDALRPPMLGGVTATPWRGDGFDIDGLLGPPLVQIGICDGLREGFLADVDYRLMADNLDWTFIQQRSREQYSLPQLNRRLLIPTRDEEAVKVIRRTYDDESRRAVIVFSPTIDHAQEFSALLRHYGFKAEALSNELPARERDRAMAQFRAGYLNALCTVDLFNEGVDVPDVDMLVFMRVTHSRRIFVQQLGRGLRVNPERGKTNVVVLDFVTDLRRIAEVIDLDRATRDGSIERLGLGNRLVQFTDQSAGSFVKEWMLDQASLILRNDDSTLELPDLEFPRPIPPGSVE